MVVNGSALSADRIFMRDAEESDTPASITLSRMNFGSLPMVNRMPRLGARFNGDTAAVEALQGHVGKKLLPREALEMGLATVAPDDLDWDD